MNKTILSSAIALSLLGSVSAHADIMITSMRFNATYAAEGTVKDDGTGAFNSVDPFFDNPWFATQQTSVITNSNGVTFAGSVALGDYDYAVDIARMSDAQVAVGVFFDWNSSIGIPVLAVFECANNFCKGVGKGETEPFGGMQTAPFMSQKPKFDGIGSLSAVPVPAAAWLMGSGLLGLVGVARRKKHNCS